jgi:hypothetical protein
MEYMYIVALIFVNQIVVIVGARDTCFAVFVKDETINDALSVFQEKDKCELL